MPGAYNEVVIALPPDEVFAFLANAENDPQWRPGVLDIERISGDGVGTVYKQGVKGPLGRRIDADVEVTDLRPNELIAFRALSGPVRPAGRYELSPDGGGTRVKFSLDAELRGAKKLLMSRAVKKSMEDEVGALDNLKRILESRG
jgi:carbon monoxide dehydrogenase subunit G